MMVLEEGQMKTLWKIYFWKTRLCFKVHPFSRSIFISSLVSLAKKNECCESAQVHTEMFDCVFL